ncbi:MAG: serine/threonine-protein phosphatase, partial [Rhodospirillales bacterium]|nr:serine/threonine-protein phosphatase [Rhodospirillales bacterium]
LVGRTAEKLEQVKRELDDPDTFTFAGAGAPSPIIGPIDGLSPYEASGVPLGIARNIPYSDRVVPFPPGTNLCLYSDALVESPDAEGGMLDVPVVIELMCDHAGSAQPLPDMVERFRGSRVEIGDDLTVLWIRRES